MYYIGDNQKLHTSSSWDNVLQHTMIRTQYYDMPWSSCSCTTCPGRDTVLRHALVETQFYNMYWSGHNNSSNNELAHILITHIICLNTLYGVSPCKKNMYHEDIILNNNILQQVHCTKFIVIIIDDKLKWANHIIYIKNKIVNGMDILLKASKVLKYKCYCSYTIFSFFPTLFTVPKYGVLLLIFTSNHSLYSRKIY